jgi:hypothetical protein
MGKFSKIIKGLLAAALSVVLVTTLLPWTALADSGPVIDRAATGTLSIDLKYNAIMCPAACSISTMWPDLTIPPS